MKPLYITNKKNNWHYQSQKTSRILLASDFVTWTARYILDLVFCFSYTDYTFFYKQLVYKQLALSLKIAKQLWGLKHLAVSNKIKLQITENRFEKDCLRVNQSLKILREASNRCYLPTPPTPFFRASKQGLSIVWSWEYCRIRQTCTQFIASSTLAPLLPHTQTHTLTHTHTHTHT